MDRECTYKGFHVIARPLPRGDGKWSTEVHIRRGTDVKPYYSSDTWDTEEEGVRRCLEFGLRIIDGELPGAGAFALP
ncbi:MAG: DUF6566 family protein [Gemmatimonadales bacterium]